MLELTNLTETESRGLMRSERGRVMEWRREGIREGLILFFLLLFLKGCSCSGARGLGALEAIDEGMIS